jgi:hypothetical protein
MGRPFSPRKKSHQTITAVRTAKTTRPSHLLIRAATTIRAKYAIDRSRNRNASSSLRNGFCISGEPLQRM